MTFHLGFLSLPGGTNSFALAIQGLVGDMQLQTIGLDATPGTPFCRILPRLRAWFVAEYKDRFK